MKPAICSDHLTVTPGAWGYCPKDSQLADHQWENTGGIGAADIGRFAKRLTEENGAEREAAS
jgi:hypothetical protein